MHVLKHQMFIAVALIAGVAIGYFVKDDPIAAKEPETEEVAKKPVADKGEVASLKALRRRIAELEKLLAETNEKSEIAISNAIAEARSPKPLRQSWGERMEAMRKNDPARYAQVTNRFAHWRRRRAEQARNKMDFLSSINTTQMSANARKTHHALQNLIARREEIEQQLQQPDLSNENRDTLMRQLRESQGELVRLNRAERQNLLNETAKRLGFEGEEMKAISATIQEVIEATDSGWGGRRPRGGPGGR